MKTRIAPTPSGYLHAGNGAAFVLAWKLAQQAGGKVLLRIDDLDAERARPEYIEDIFATLAWLGITWDEGPRNALELERTWSQQHRLDEYHAILQKLRGTGLLYACACSRKDVLDRTGTTEYDGHCRDKGLDLELPAITWRLRLPPNATVDMKTWRTGRVEKITLPPSDPVLLQRNGRPAYHIASLADDLHFNVDTVLRGTDLLAATAIQLHIAQLLGLSAFGEIHFLHHSLLVGDNGEKLSKSAGSASLHHLLICGQGPEAIHGMADQLLDQFLAGVHKSL